MTTRDVIDELAGIDAGSHLDLIRRQRTEARDNAQASYAALFEPRDDTQVSHIERLAVATFVAGLHGDDTITRHYLEQLQPQARAIAGAVVSETQRAKGRGPYGHYPDGPLSPENQDGPTLHIGSLNLDVLGPRLAAALEHAHLLVLHPRDASPDALRSLLAAGWSTTGIVTLSQLVAFLAFQIRVIAGLRVLSQAISSTRREAAE